MAARADGPGWFENESSQNEIEITDDDISEFNALYGQAVLDMHEHLRDIQSPKFYFMFCRALIAVIGISATERTSGLDK